MEFECFLKEMRGLAFAASCACSDAVLIGETLMRAADKHAKLAELRGV